MTQNDTLILRVALARKKSIYRDIEIEASKSLYALAEAINVAFGFDFDHAFGFYSKVAPSKMFDANPRYELFADMEDGDSDAGSVERTKIATVFGTRGKTMLFLFDYGDEWRFRVELRALGEKAPKRRYPRLVASMGDAPLQYPDYDDEDE